MEKRDRVKKTGALVHFKPDPEIFGTTEFDFTILARRLRELAFLNKGLYISIEDERTDEFQEFHYKGGIIEYVQYINRQKTPLHDKPIYLEGQNEDIQVEVAVQYNDSYHEQVFSFAKNINPVNVGTHLSGFTAALSRAGNQYLPSSTLHIFLLETTLDGDDIR